MNLKFSLKIINVKFLFFCELFLEICDAGDLINVRKIPFVESGIKWSSLDRARNLCFRYIQLAGLCLFSEFIYQEAFLTTYRTFIVCKELIDKLLYRFYKFQHVKDKKRLSRNAFSLLIRVVDELG